MRVIGIIQARMNSTRLPGKAIVDICGFPLVYHIYRRLLKCEEIDKVLVAVGWMNPEPILDICSTHAMYWRVGRETDLLERIIDTSVWFEADAVLRVRADCLFLDPRILDEMVAEFKHQWPHIRGLTNWPRRYVSEGLDAEVYGMELLAALDKMKLCPREDFATWAIREGLLSPYLRASRGGTDLHMSIDTQEDLDHARKVVEKIGVNNFSYKAALEAWDEV